MSGIAIDPSIGSAERLITASREWRIPPAAMQTVPERYDVEARLNGILYLVGGGAHGLIVTTGYVTADNYVNVAVHARKSAELTWFNAASAAYPNTRDFAAEDREAMRALDRAAFKPIVRNSKKTNDL